MKRRLSSDLAHWAETPGRKPLVIRGARQVGKSYLVRTWGAERFGRVVEVNFERDPAAAGCFVDSDPRATLRRIEALTRQSTSPFGSFLLFLDEIQAAPEVLSRLRWFAEELPEVPVVAAGSLLDFVLASPPHGVPVGRISYLHLEPMGFREFLDALDEGALRQLLDEDVTLASITAGTAIPRPIHARLSDLFRQFLLTGGMPAAVERYRTQRSHPAVAELHADLLATFRDDFGKYAGRVPHRRLATVLAAVPRQLGSAFRYSLVDREERASALGQAVELLTRARVCHMVSATSAEGVPLAAGVKDRGYKLVALDIGLAASALGVSLRGLEGVADITFANEGALAEQVVGQLLRVVHPAHHEPALYYWRRDAPGAQAEVDYVIQHGSTVVPVEVKAGTSGTLKSLHLLMAQRRWRYAVRFNADLPSLAPVSVKTTSGDRANYALLSLPLYLVEQIHRLLDETQQRTPRRRRAGRR